MSRSRPAVLLIGDTLNFGGTEGQFVKVARGLDRSRWDLDVACMGAEGPLGPRLEAVGVKPWTCGRGSFMSPRFHARHPDPRPAPAGAAGPDRSLLRLLQQRAGCSRRPGRESQRDLGNLRPWHHERIHAAMLRPASHVLVNSEATAERLARTHAACSGRVSVILNGVDLSRFGPADSRTASDQGITIGTTLANLRPEKGLPELVEAAALVKPQAPEARFVVWGEGPLRETLEVRIRELGLTDTVVLHGSTRRPEDALRHCDVFVLPSLSEACSNVLLEAMATGLPVVTTRIGGNPGLIEDGRSGLLVAAGEPKPLAAAIAKVLGSRGLAAEPGAAARARALAEFGMGRMIERVESLYRRALGLETPDPAVAPAKAR
jgi:glycosyltransferase involved in cell wall biosynthesis